MQISLLAAAIAATLLLSPAPQEPTPAPAPDPYPAVRNASVVRFFIMEGDLRSDGMHKVLTELSTKEAECRTVSGPTLSSVHSKQHFLALQVSEKLASKDVIKSLRKCAPSVEELQWAQFRGAKEGPGPIYGQSGQSLVIGMSQDMRWFEYDGGVSSFYFVSGKLDAKELRDRYRKLYQPLGGGELGELSRDEIAWTLTTPIDEAAAKRAEKAIAKLAGVREIKIEPANGAMRAVVELDKLSASAPPPATKGDETRAASIALRFNTNAILDELEKEKLTLAAAAKAGEEGH